MERNTANRWADALANPGVRARYEAKVLRRDGCWVWLGALHRHGHGRFWLGREPVSTSSRRPKDHVVIAHRYGYALNFGLDTLIAAPVLAHTCDEAWCQNPEHLEPSTQADNHHDWMRRRWHPRSPLRDVRGQRGRALAARAAGREGSDLHAALTAGVSSIDRDQLLLW